MKVIKDNKVVEDDWRLLRQVCDALTSGDVILPYDYWLTHQVELENHKGKLGVLIDGNTDIETSFDELIRFELIALDFPAFTDGRCYSHARLLRERYGYEGELRAVGDVLQDQLFYMQRCGINSYALRSDKNIEAALHALKEISVRYQNASDTGVPVYKQRLSV